MRCSRGGKWTRPNFCGRIGFCGSAGREIWQLFHRIVVVVVRSSGSGESMNRSAATKERVETLSRETPSRLPSATRGGRVACRSFFFSSWTDHFHLHFTSSVPWFSSSSSKTTKNVFLLFVARKGKTNFPSGPSWGCPEEQQLLGLDSVLLLCCWWCPE